MTSQSLSTTPVTMPRLMGIVNVTPDSFSDGGKYLEGQTAIAHGLALLEEGVQILDIGGESTRPQAEEISVEEELSRVMPVIEGLRKKTDAILSIDTRKPDVALKAIEAGASIWNDVSALTFDDRSLAIAAKLECEIVLMHAQGLPADMQDNPHYENVVGEVREALLGRVHACILSGVERNRLIIDPGIGFGKTLDHNLALTRNLDVFVKTGLPVMYGASRKSLIGAMDANAPANERLGGSLALALEAASKGASILRVHDVAQTRQALAVWAFINR